MHTRSGWKCITWSLSPRLPQLKSSEMFPTHGPPATLVSNSGSNFTRSSWKRMESSTSKWHLIILPQMAWQRGLCEPLKKDTRRWRMKVSKQSYHNFFSVTIPPLIVRQEFHQQNYSWNGDCTHSWISLFQAWQMVLGTNSLSRRQHMITMLRRWRF